MPVSCPSDRVRRTRRVLIVLLVGLLTAIAATQELPDEALTALRTAQRSAAEALATYDRHSPDRVLWSEALSAGAAAAEAAPDHPAPHRFLAQAYLEVGWYARSWDAWNAYLDTGGTVDAAVERQRVEVAAWMGLNAYARGRGSDAIPFLETIIRYRPADLAANDRLARIYLERGEASAALPYLEALAGRVPELETTRQRLLRVERFGAAAVEAYEEGEVARSAGAATVALARFQRATTLAPGYAAAWRATGELAEDLERFDVARGAYAELLRQNARDAGALAGLGRLARAEGDLEAAVGWFERAVAAAPDEAAYADDWAESGRLLEEQRAAEEEAARAAEVEAAEEAQAQAQAEAARQAAEEEARQAEEERAAAEEAAREAALEAQRQAEEEAAARAREQAQAQAEVASAAMAEDEAAAQAGVEAEAARQAAEDEAARRAAAERERDGPRARAAESSLDLFDSTVAHRRDGGAPSPSVAFVDAPGLLTDMSAWTNATLHLRLQVEAKPSDAPVEYQICLVPSDVMVRPACTHPSLLRFTMPGVHENSTRWSDLVGADDVDWTAGVSSVMMILRREDGAAVDAPIPGDGAVDLDRYVPMTVRVRAVAVPDGVAFTGWP